MAAVFYKLSQTKFTRNTSKKIPRMKINCVW